MEPKDRVLVGNEEWCGLPSLNMPAIKARVDSGAKISTLHALNIRPFKRNETDWVSFDVQPLQGSRRTVVTCEAPVQTRTTIKSSSGVSERRYVISVSLALGGMTWDVRLTLTNRSEMGYRMLLGREAMKGRLLVDPDAKCCLGEPTEAEAKAHYTSDKSLSKGLKIAILASNPDLYSNRRLMEAGQQLGHEMCFLNVQTCYIKLDSEAPEVFTRGGHSFSDLDAVIPRIRPSATYYGTAIVRQFQSMGVYCQNTAEAIRRSRDKLFSLQLFLREGLPIPVSSFAHSPIDTDDLIDIVGGSPLIVKLLEGTQGRGVILAETRKAAESVVGAFRTLNANLLVQEFISEASGRDLRCLVINGKVVASMERVARDGDFRANLHQGGVALPVRITPQERKLAIKSAKVLGLDVAGVDILRSDRGPMLIEVNSSPGLEGIEQVSDKDIATIMIQTIEKKLKWSE